MKNILLFICAFFLLSSTALAQNLTPAPADKAVVYFVRASSLGFAINFTYFDSTTLIGKFNGVNYFRYECNPGKHLFWARSENRDFIEADLEAGHIYFVEAVPQMGAIKAGVQLIPVNTGNAKEMKPLLKLMGKKPGLTFLPDDLVAEAAAMQDVIERGMKKHSENMASGKKYPFLSTDMYYQP